MAAIRTANSTWEGDLTNGGGRVTAATSGTFADLAVTFPTRGGEPEGNTSPEELIAAAHASCYGMALSAGLTRAGTPPGQARRERERYFRRRGRRSDRRIQRSNGPGHGRGRQRRRLCNGRGGSQGRLPDLTRAGRQRGVECLRIARVAALTLLGPVAKLKTFENIRG